MTEQDFLVYEQIRAKCLEAIAATTLTPAMALKTQISFITWYQLLIVGLNQPTPTPTPPAA